MCMYVIYIYIYIYLYIYIYIYDYRMTIYDSIYIYRINEVLTFIHGTNSAIYICFDSEGPCCQTKWSPDRELENQAFSTMEIAKAFKQSSEPLIVIRHIRQAQDTFS